MTSHALLAVIGLAASVWLTQIALAAGALARNPAQRSLLRVHRQVAARLHLGGWERAQQPPAFLSFPKWLIRALALAAICFTCWHALGAAIQK